MRRRALVAALLLLAAACDRVRDKQFEESLVGMVEQDSGRIVKIQMAVMHGTGESLDLDGTLGPGTREAIKKFQSRREIPPTGYVGARTWDAIAALDRVAGPFEVRRLQEGLRRAGCDPGAVDGRAGTRTREAVIRFQRERGLQPTGALDEGTWSALQPHLPSPPQDGPPPGSV